jgi:4,5-dihydroxyphthalate decarboxylase
MSDLPLTYAGVSYYDRTRALERGEVVPDGIDLRYERFEHVGELFRIQAQERRFESSEMSLSTLVLMRSRGADDLLAIPVFPSRAFRHSQVYVREGSGIDKPEDLAGKRVGIPEYQMTAAVWIRAFLEEDYGVAPSDVHWLTGGLSTPAYQERLRHDPPPGVTIELIPSDKTLEGMLESGEIDALSTAAAPRPFTQRKGVRRLFPDYRSVEEDYFRRTGYFPIMHTVCVRKDVYEANPWVPLSLLNAFEEAKRIARHRLRDLDTLAVMHPWIAAELNAIDEMWGGKDPFALGVEANLETVRAVCRYSHHQGLAEREVDPLELFPPEVHDWQPAPISTEDAS